MIISDYAQITQIVESMSETLLFIQQSVAQTDYATTHDRNVSEKIERRKKKKKKKVKNAKKMF
jgi:hypothetical protein